MPQALRRNDTADKFQQITEKIEAALSDISYNKLEISEEFQEQVILLYIRYSPLTPNYVLKSLIGLWCDSNGVELPKKQGSCRTKKCFFSLTFL
jgi:hypothetical protein